MRDLSRPFPPVPPPVYQVPAGPDIVYLFMCTVLCSKPFIFNEAPSIFRPDDLVKAVSHPSVNNVV